MSRKSYDELGVFGYIPIQSVVLFAPKGTVEKFIEENRDAVTPKYMRSEKPFDYIGFKDNFTNW